MQTFETYDSLTTFEIPLSQNTFPIMPFVSSINSDNLTLEELFEIAESIYNELKIVEIKAGYIHLRDTLYVLDDSISIGDAVFQCGRDIAQGLTGSSNAFLFACSCSDELHNLSKNYFANDNYLEGFLIDTLGSYIVEKTASDISSTLSQMLEVRGCKTSARYSPGYCGWSVSEQNKFYSLLPKDFCNISINDEYQMHPIKSVNGIIGYGAKSKNLKYNCDLCKKASCALSKINKHSTKTRTLL